MVWIDWTKLGGLVVALMVGCGPTSGDDDGADSAADEGATGNEDDGTADGVSATGADDGVDGADDAVDDAAESDGPDTGGLECSDFESSTGALITMSVVNMRRSPVYLARKGCGDPIGLRAAEGEPPARVSFPDCELPACHASLDGNCAVACAGGGGACQEAVVRVAPGATHTRTWDGSVWVDTTLPVECVVGDCDSACHQQMPSTPGMYTADVEVSGCPNLETGVCDCEDGADVCDIVVEDGAPSPMPQTLTMDFAYPGDTMPTIVIR